MMGNLHIAIARDGIRNSHLLAVAPAGTISLLAGNVSSGAEEPVFAADAERTVLDAIGKRLSILVTDHAVRLWREIRGDRSLPPVFIVQRNFLPQHLAMQAALQVHVDQAIAKTINLASGFAFDDFDSIYRRAHKLGLKRYTTSPNRNTGGAVITSL